MTDPIVNVRLFTDRKVALTMVATMAIAVGPMGISTMIIPMILQSPTRRRSVSVSRPRTPAGCRSSARCSFRLHPAQRRISRAVGARASMLLGTALFTLGSAMLIVFHDSVVGMWR